MAVSLNPEHRYRRTLAHYCRETDTPHDMLAARMGVSPGMLTGYLNAEIVPDPETYLRLRKVLNVPYLDRHGLDHDYVQLLARAQTKPRKRTSAIQDRHVISSGAPDPLAAKTAEQLVDKLREVYQWALRPSYRELEKRTGGALKRSTICDMLHPENKVLPRFDRYAKFLEACRVTDMTYWIKAWRELAPPSQKRGHLMAEYMQERLQAEVS
ncbi:helix-turn-helix domain-containing protein [Streptomyces sp. NPDC003395]